MAQDIKYEPRILRLEATVNAWSEVEVWFSPFITVKVKLHNIKSQLEAIEKAKEIMRAYGND